MSEYDYASLNATMQAVAELELCGERTDHALQSTAPAVSAKGE